MKVTGKWVVTPPKNALGYHWIRYKINGKWNTIYEFLAWSSHSVIDKISSEGLMYFKNEKYMSFWLPKLGKITYNYNEEISKRQNKNGSITYINSGPNKYHKGNDCIYHPLKYKSLQIEYFTQSFCLIPELPKKLLPS